MLRLFIVRLFIVRMTTVLALAPWAVAAAQGVPGAPANTGGNNGNGGGNANSSGGNNSGSTRSPSSGDSSRPTYLSGVVVASDGTLPGAGVSVQRVCGASVTAETHTDSRGRFSLQLGGGGGVVTDVSSNAVVRTSDAGGSGSGRGGGTQANAFGCDLRAVLQGYRSDAVPLGTRHPMDDPDVGTILLHPISDKGQGLTLSATTGFAPKAARQAYEKGVAALRHNKPEKAQKDFVRAVDLYPRFAAAWFDLGRTYEWRAHPSDAREAYTKAAAADPSYASPYERLYMLDLMEGRWQQAADTSEKVLRLDPIHFQRAYYFNALANAHLQNLPAAEKSAREATKLEGPAAEPRAHYILGLVLASKGNYSGAAESLRTFLKTAKRGPEEQVANRVLAMIESREAAEAK